MPDQASAGREAKADLRIVMHTGGPPENEIQITSSAGRLFGERIREVVQFTLQALGVKNTRVEVFDRAAFDWVIMARVETAAKRLCPDLSTEALPEAIADPKPTVRDRMRRSRLYLPGNNPDLMTNAGLFAPDGIILDLEDSVSPAEKDSARILVRNALRAVDFGGAERMVRINPLPEGLNDLPALVPHHVNMVLVPKAESGANVAEIVNAINQIATRHNIQDPIWIMPILETAKGVWRAYEIASASDQVAAITFGAEDFTRDVQAERTVEGRESFVARSMVVLGARAAGVQPIDTVFSDVENEEGLRSSTKEAISLGFEGKGCIHPRQIAVLHDAFQPEEADIIHALKVKAAMDEAQRMGASVISLGTKMIDPPVVARALRVLRVAEEMGIDINGLKPAG
ncbi:MAG: citrate lyase ACP [Candidatus Eisenbacteria sp.]|nr:citrate lyase ACP [Candidatus Eisenbacteria bacterium]